LFHLQLAFSVHSLLLHRLVLSLDLSLSCLDLCLRGLSSLFAFEPQGLLAL
jgi:hypothetical protein